MSVAAAGSLPEVASSGAALSGVPPPAVPPSELPSLDPPSFGAPSTDGSPSRAPSAGQTLHAASRFAARPAEFRAAVRAGRFTGQTAGQCPGHTQGNLAILPRDYAEEFLRFCRLNPKPCPVIGVTEVGDPSVPELGEGIDLRTDIPGYCVFEHGEKVAEVADLRSVWRDDFVGFVIGCSLSFEEALLQDGIPVRHIEQNTTVPMYDTTVANRPAGRFAGTGVVSMRPMTAAQAIRAIQITSRFPGVHGAPVHFGDPSQLGIRDIDRPDYGEPVEIRPGEVPVFWACGVTPQQAIRSARPPIAITHQPGHMLVTDLRNSRMSVF